MLLGGVVKRAELCSSSGASGKRERQRSRNQPSSWSQGTAEKALLLKLSGLLAIHNRERTSQKNLPFLRIFTTQLTLFIWFMHLHGIGHHFVCNNSRCTAPWPLLPPLTSPPHPLKNFACVEATIGLLCCDIASIHSL